MLAGPGAGTDASAAGDADPESAGGFQRPPGDRDRSDATSRPSGDAQLVERLIAGEEDAYRAVVAEWGPSLLRVARTYLPSRASAEEAVQETWVAVLAGLPRFEGRSSLKTWVFRVLVNIAKSRAVKDARTVPLSALGDERHDPTVPGGVHQRADEAQGGWISVAATLAWQNAPEAAVLATEARHALAGALLRLPRRQRAVVALRDVYGYTSAEACDLLEVTPVAQRVLLHRGRAALRGRLGSYYADDRPLAQARSRRPRGAHGPRRQT